MKKLNIIMVNYNSTDETIKSVSSIMECDQNFHKRIYVIDNNSLEEESNKLNEIKNIPEVKVVFLDENIGYFPALNVGLDYINTDDCANSLTIICNNDIIFDDDFFIKLNEIVFDEDVHVICPSVKTINNVYQNPSMEHKPSRLRFYMYSLYYSNYYLGKAMLYFWRKLGYGIDTNFKKDNDEKDIFIGIGAIYILTCGFFKNNSKLFYPLFLYGEEAFLSRQVFKDGGRIRYMPQLEVIHLESVSTKKIPSKNNYLLNKKAFSIYKDFFKK